MNKVFAVEGMTCEHCARTVERVVKKVPGVQAAVVDFPAKKLTVEMDDGVLAKDIMDKVAKAGYKAIE